MSAAAGPGPAPVDAPEVPERVQAKIFKKKTLCEFALHFLFNVAAVCDSLGLVH